MSQNASHVFRFSPSLCHRYIIEHTRQSLRYDGGDVGKWQNRLRRKFRQLIGDIPGSRVPLDVRSLWKREHALGTIERIVFTSEPSADVPAYVCLPRNGDPPYTFFICLQGHTSGMHNSIGVDRKDESKPIEVEGDRDFALGCMERGIAALCIEGRAFGDLAERIQPINPHFHVGEERRKDRCHDTMMQALLLGRTLVGERLFDVDRGIDYLASRGDVDMKRLGLMGLSGGGMLTIYAAALLHRIRLAMPAAHFCTYRDGLMSNHHCACCYIPGIYNYAEMADIAGLFAPRPIVVVTGKDDPSKPIEAVRTAFSDLKRIYRAAGAERNCQLVVGEGGHRFYAQEAWQKMLPLLNSHV